MPLHAVRGSVVQWEGSQRLSTVHDRHAICYLQTFLIQALYVLTIIMAAEIRNGGVSLICKLVVCVARSSI
jgi:hypothetical protein